ncbi:MAG: hypothetical protein CL583_16835 [Alteromonadaceae bacterium]|nr:hypothetical protein [Alteromonadaceae bacterium]
MDDRKQTDSRLSQAVEFLNIGSLEEMVNGEIDQASKLAFLTIFRSLAMLVGGDRKAMRHWLETENSAFGEAPIELIVRGEGLDSVVAYLERIRHPQG